MPSPAIMWFRQDLRLADNAALAAAASAGPLVCLYILDDETPGHWRMGGASRWWLHRSLEQLCLRVPLVLRKGAADQVIARLLRETGAISVHFTRDYAPWSRALEARVKAASEEAGATCHRYGGFLLHEPESICNGQGAPYKVYTPFARACFAAGEPRPPHTVQEIVSWNKPAGDSLAGWQLLPAEPGWASDFETHWKPGEQGARTRLKKFIANDLAGYANERDRPARDTTSRLSPHLHFGEISPAQCWLAVRAAAARAGGHIDLAAEKFLKELLWREFSCHLLHHWPILPEQPFRQEFASFPWIKDSAALNAWQQGLTGYPLVDAGMRQLWATGSMHNRVRMVAASFLTKHLLHSWTEGARWFWDTLVDADLASNSASWQWVAGCGADAAPYFRIFNPVLQGKKFDPEGSYVRKWVPELSRLPPEFIHRPWEAPPHVLAAAGIELGTNYPYPVVDHHMARDRALAALRTSREMQA